MKLIITSNQSIFLIILTTCVLLLGMTVESYADTPTANSASVTFDEVTGQAVMSWDFGTHSARDSCIVKTDFHVIPDNIDPATAENSDVVGKVFLGDNTNSLYDLGGITFETIFNDAGKLTESTIPCTGSMTFDIPSGFHYDDIQLFMTFAEIINPSDVAAHTGSYLDMDTIDEEFDSTTIKANVLHEIDIQYTNYIAFAPLQCGGANAWELGTEYFKDINFEDTIVTLDVKDVCDQNANGESTNPDGTSGNGNETDTNDTDPFPTTGEYYLVFPIITESVQSSGGGSSNDHKSRPTFGLDYNTHVQAVDVGLSINDKSFTVSDNYWTPIPMQNLNIGEIQNFTATTYAPKTLHVMEFLFGIPEVGEWDKAEASVEVYLDYRGDIIDVIAENTEDVIIDIDSVITTASNSKCMVTSNTPTCNTVSIEVIFNEAPVGTVLALQAIDYKGRTNILYFNDGLELDGDSTNPPIQIEITSPLKYKGLQTVQRVDKALDTWMTLDEKEPVLVYQMNSFGTFIPIEWRTVVETPDEITNTMQREHSEFASIIQSENNKALDIFDSSLIQGITPDSFAHKYTQSLDRTSQLSEIINYEIKRANDVISEKYTLE